MVIKEFILFFFVDDRKRLYFNSVMNEMVKFQNNINKKTILLFIFMYSLGIFMQMAFFS